MESRNVAGAPGWGGRPVEVLLVDGLVPAQSPHAGRGDRVSRSPRAGKAGGVDHSGVHEGGPSLFDALHHLRGDVPQLDHPFRGLSPVAKVPVSTSRVSDTRGRHEGDVRVRAL